jgi:soluble lytic murein transglycosylase
MLEAVILSALVSTAAPITAADLAPLLGAGLEAEAGAALAERRFADAAAKLARSSSPGAAFLRALALVEAGRPAEAIAPLAGLEASLPDVADRIAHLRGEALLAAKRPREALAAWATVPDGSLLAGEARLARARAAASLGDAAAALAALEPLVVLGPPADLARPDVGATALLLAGRVHADGGAPAAARARAAFLACWSEHPLSPEAAPCRAALATLPAPAGAPPSTEDVVRRAEVLLDANRNDAALALLGPVLEGLAEAAPDEPFACRVRAAAGRAHRKERNHAKAIELLRPVADRCSDPEVRVRSLYLLASAASISGDRMEAVALYRRLARDFPGHSFADDALFFAADLLARAGRSDEAREALAGIARDHAGGDYRDEARFRIAWLAKQAGDADAAMAQLLAIEEEAADPYEHARAAYWRARLLASRGERGARAARDLWADLVARYPADYYGLLSRARLSDREGDALPSPVLAASEEVEPSSWDAGELRADAHFRAGMLLHRLGLRREAAEELGAIDGRRLREAATATPEAVLLVAHLLDRAGDHRAAHNLLRIRARGALRRPPEGENLRAWRIAYPPAFREDVRRWAPAAGVPVDLLQALMREESALDPRAVSPAGAVGLTQLMLPTAREVARQLRLGRVGRAELANPSLNIRLGSRYLGSLIRRFDGSVALALAAYNAGGGAVSRWLGERRGVELDEFVEEIPIEETRGYVKRVLRSFAAYRLLYGTASDTGAPRLLEGAAKD